MTDSLANPFRQALYWSIGNNQNLGFLEDPRYYTISGVIPNNNSDWCVFTGVGAIDFESMPVPDDELVIYLYEPLTFYDDVNTHNMGYYTETLSTRAHELDSISKWQQQHQKPVSVMLCDYGYLNQHYANISTHCYDVFVRLNTQYQHHPCAQRARPRRFFVSNNRWTTARNHIAIHVNQYSRYLSWPFLSDLSNHSLDWYNTSLVNVELEQQLNHTPTWIDLKYKRKQDPQLHPMFMPLGPTNKMIYYKYLASSDVAIVSETRYHNPTANFSEKTLEVINYRRPFVVVAPCGTLEYLQQLGFKTFSNCWDESYDTIRDPVERLCALEQTIDDIANQDSNTIVRSTQQACQHNRRLLKRLHKNRTIL